MKNKYKYGNIPFNELKPLQEVWTSTDRPFKSSKTQDFIKKDKHFKKEMLNNIPLGRFATLSDVATAVVFLSSDASSMITGSSIFVDGGWTAK